jgi:hypothetical protein
LILSVTFDDTTFPFSKLHPNAGARLCSKIPFLPQNLLNPITNHGGECTDDMSLVLLLFFFENSDDFAENGAQNHSIGDIGFELSHGTDPKEDAPAPPAVLEPTLLSSDTGGSSLESVCVLSHHLPGMHE